MIPSTKEEISSFLGIAGLKSRVPSVLLLAHPLYEAALDSAHKFLLTPITTHFQKFRGALLQALALHRPDLHHPFSLYVIGKEGYALRVLGHQLGSPFIPMVCIPVKKN